MVKEAWMDQVVDGWGTFVHKKKLKGVKMVLKKWNMEEFGMLHTKQQQIAKEMNELDLREEQGDLGDEYIKKRLYLQQEFWKVEKFNESLLLQKSRARWIKEGDNNSKLFHSIINWKRRKNAVKGIHVDGIWIKEPNRVKDGVKNTLKIDFWKQILKDQSLMELTFNKSIMTIIACSWGTLGWRR